MRTEEIGKELTIRWTIKVNGEVRDLRDLDLTLILECPGGRIKIMDFDVKGDDYNEIWTKFRGTQQKYTGLYSLHLYVNKGKHMQSKMTACNFLKLVPACSCN